MIRIATILLTTVLLTACGDENKSDSKVQDEIIAWTVKSIEWTDQSDGSRKITFESPYFYGDKITFAGLNGSGTGYVDGIVLAQDGSVYYTVQDADAPETIYGGVYPDEMKLIKRGTTKAEQAGTGQPATRSLSDSEGSYKPQPEAEGRSR
jgi:hypothetical protein